MAELAAYQYFLIGLIFVWSGTVRSALGFGGAVLSLPFLLLVHNDPLIFLPIIAAHLLVFSSLTVYKNHRISQQTNTESTVAWAFLGKLLAVMIIPKLIGVFGIITLPPKVMGSIIFMIISVYALSYIFNRPFESKNKVIDLIFLILGAYISGTSLIGAPLVIVVCAKYIPRTQIRDTLFVLWFVLVIVKMASFVYAKIDLQLIHHLWLLPCAGLGHIIGLKLHDYLLNTDSVKFYRILGLILLITSMIGLYRAWVA